MNFSLRLSVAAAALIVLAGCGMFGGKKAPLACPRAGILKNAEIVTKFRPGPGRDLTDVVYHAEFFHLKSVCKYTRKGVTVDVTLAMTAERGPAIRASKVSLEYFVAITGPGGDVLAKEEFATRVTFPNNVTRARATDELQQIIPLRRGATGANHRIIVGFQLQPHELEYNRQQPRR